MQTSLVRRAALFAEEYLPSHCTHRGMQAQAGRQASDEEEIQEEEEMQTRVLMYYICNICVCMFSNDYKCSRV